MNFRILVAVMLFLGPAAAEVPPETLSDHLSLGGLFTDAVGGVMSPLQLVTPSDSARGCCVLNASPLQCTYANHGYCRNIAGKQSVSFKFYEGTPCKNVAQCPAPAAN